MLTPTRLNSFFGQAREALLTFHVIYGHFDIPSDFQIPRHDSDWHPYIQGMKLGLVFEDIKRGILFNDHRATLITMGIDESLIPIMQPGSSPILPTPNPYGLKGKKPVTIREMQPELQDIRFYDLSDEMKLE